MPEKKESQQHNKEKDFKALLSKIATILDNDVQMKGDEMIIKKNRNLHVEIAGFDKSKDERVVGAYIDIQIHRLEHGKYKALIIGEIPLQQKEVKKAEIELREANVTIGAVQNHLLFEEPRLIYIGFQKLTEDLVEFAQAIAPLWKEL